MADEKVRPEDQERPDKPADPDSTWGYHPKDGADEPDEAPPGRASSSLSPADNRAEQQEAPGSAG